MTLSAGHRMGPYEIVEPIGSGGMGHVFRARDTKLDREVAIKVLPDEFARDPDRRARFEREARLLAALNHPHIAAIYGVESVDGVPALVLELVEGETLGEVLRERGRVRRLPLEETISIARQVVDALVAAHDKGIVHRDLKPDNIKVARGGTVKLLDFGLGRMSPGDQAAGAASGIGFEGSELPTVTPDWTLPGTLLGTPAYMSPEQSRGSAVDRRSDIWAFGCVLFEMVTGCRAFEGETPSDQLAAVLAGTPDWSRVPAQTPPSLCRLLRRCLEKDRRKRLRDIGDARFELEEAAEGEEQRAATGAQPGPSTEVRLARLTDSVGTKGSPAVSPDGKMVAFVALAGGRRQIWIRLLAGGTPLQVTHDEADHDEPRWMPDSSALVYYRQEPGTEAGHLWQVSALGGPPRRLVASLGGADVSHGGRRLAFFQRTGEAVALVTAALDGSGTEPLISVPPDRWCDGPRWSPDDELIAFRRAGPSFDNLIEVVAVADRRCWTAAHAGLERGHSWLPDGSSLVYSSSIGSTLTYPPVHNLRLAAVDGSGDRQITFGDVSYLEPDVHASGRLLAARMRSRSDIWRFPIDGTPADNMREAMRITHQTGHVQVPSASPDGREIVYVSDSGGHSNLWVTEIDSGAARQLTFETGHRVTVALPQWAPTGDRILFVRIDEGRICVCLVNSDGTGLTTILTDAFAPCWSGDGKSVYWSWYSGRIERLDLENGENAVVRSDRAINPALPHERGTLYFVHPPQLPLGVYGETEVCRAAPEDGPVEVLARVPTSRVPLSPTFHLHPSASPDSRWLAAPLLDRSTANIWLIPTDGGPMRAVTDFGDRSVFIARWISFSPDSRYVYAAVADIDADVVMLDGVPW